jgi:hypothetical protein
MTLYIRPFQDITRAPRPRTSKDTELLAVIADHLDITIQIDDTLDYEDWMEPATLLGAALKTEHTVCVISPLKRLEEALASPDYTRAGTVCPDVLIGRLNDGLLYDVPQTSLVWPPRNQDLANQYAQTRTFHTHAQRDLALAHFIGDEAEGYAPPPLGDALQGTDLTEALHSFKGKDVFIKQVWPGKAFPPYKTSIPSVLTEKTGFSLLAEKMEYNICRYEGNKNAILLQSYIEMTFETRFFVINGRVVCGAGIIEAHTPQDCESETRITPFFQQVRNKGPVARDTEMAQKMLKRADEIAFEFSQECPELPSYCLDLAITSDMRIAVVEINPIAMSGLYGINPDLYISALLTL